MYEKEYGQAAGGDQVKEQARALDHMQVDLSKADAMDDSRTEKGSASIDVAMGDNCSQEETKKRKSSASSEGKDTAIAMQKMMQMMQAQSEAKDRQIEALTATINGLQAQIQKLMGAMNVQAGTDIFSLDA